MLSLNRTLSSSILTRCNRVGSHTLSLSHRVSKACGKSNFKVILGVNNYNTSELINCVIKNNNQRNYTLTQKLNGKKKDATNDEEEDVVELKSITTESVDLKNQKFTPMMNQYFKIKEKHSDYLLLFRMGDFYEIFFEDAVKASQVLHITVCLILDYESIEFIYIS